MQGKIRESTIREWKVKQGKWWEGKKRKRKELTVRKKNKVWKC